MKWNSKFYDFMKWFIPVVIPALCILITTLGDTWGWDTKAVVTTIMAVAVFLGTCLNISSKTFWKDGGQV